jgi:hypothetical protein
MIASIWIIGACAIAGMWAITGSPWKAVCYTIWIAATLLFWAGVAALLYGLGS